MSYAGQDRIIEYFRNLEMTFIGSVYIHAHSWFKSVGSPNCNCLTGEECGETGGLFEDVTSTYLDSRLKFSVLEFNFQRSLLFIRIQESKCI